MKTIDFCMVAWPRSAARLQYLRESLRSFRAHVTAPRHKIMAYVSLETCDVSTENFRAANDICREYHAEPHWRNMPPSLGGNQNDALMWGYGEYKLFSQDDWGWLKTVNISDDADFLESRPFLALLRYATYYTEFEGNLAADLKSVKMDGPYPYGDQPHLRRADFATRKSATGGDPIGFYVLSESGDYGSPEHQMANHLTKHGWKIAAYSPNVCDHIGSLSSCPTRQTVPGE